jgi:hypothetical protein
MIYTTLERIRAHSPCAKGWKKLLDHLNKTQADDEPLAMTVILDSNNLSDALWCLRAEPQHASIWRLLAVHYARQVQHLMTDPRTLAALDVAERHARGLATDDELAAAGTAGTAAWTAAGAARTAAARNAARTAAGTAARDAAWVAAWTVGDAARDAARGAAWVAGATWDVAWGAWEAAHEKQATDLRTVLEHYDAAPGCAIHGWRVTA